MDRREGNQKLGREGDARAGLLRVVVLKHHQLERILEATGRGALFAGPRSRIDRPVGLRFTERPVA